MISHVMEFRFVWLFIIHSSFLICKKTKNPPFNCLSIIFDIAELSDSLVPEFLLFVILQNSDSLVPEFLLFVQ